MNKFVAHGITILVLTSFLTSCSFHRLVTRRRAQTIDRSAMRPADSNHVAFGSRHAFFPQPDTLVIVPDTTGAVKKLVDELTPIWKKRTEYRTFSGKAKVHFEGPDDKQEFSANFHVRKDSIIWINVTAFGGLPAALIFITRDSFFLVIPLKKEYKKVVLADVAKILPTKVDFTSLQNLIVGDPLRDGTIQDATSFGGSWSIQVSDSSYLQRITYNKADTTIRTAQLRTRDLNGPQAMSEYGSYEMIDGRRVSTQRVLNIQDGDDIYMLDLNFSKEEFDTPLEYPFSIPSSYSEKKKDKEEKK